MISGYLKQAKSFEIHCWNEETEWIELALEYGRVKEDDWKYGKIIIGDVTFGKLFKNFALKLLAVSFGAIIYYVVIQAVLTLLKVDSQYLKLMSAAIVAVFLTVPNLGGGHHKKHKHKEVPTCSK